MEYSTDDQILPLLGLDKEKSIPVRIEITENEVCLFVGRRDWQWDRKTGKLIETGTFFE